MDKSFWQIISPHKQYESLSSNIKTDVLIIGAGFVGLTLACSLAKSGVSCVVVESDRIGSGSSGKNTGKATIQHSNTLGFIAKKYGMDKAKHYLELNQKGFEYIRCLTRNNKGIAKLQSSYIFSTTSLDAQKIEYEHEISLKLGLPVDLIDKLPIPIKIGNALELPDQLMINPKEYINCLSDMAETLGVRILETTKVTDIKKGTPSSILVEKGYSILANRVVMACHYPIYNKGGLMVPRLTPARSYIIAGKYEQEYPGGMYISIGNQVRSIAGYENMLLIGGAGHRTGEKNTTSYKILEDYAKEHFGDINFEYKWSAQDFTTYDTIPFIGKVMGEENIYLATGFNKWGITACTGAGLCLSELITDGVFAGQRTFTPKRYSDLMTTAFVRGSADTAKEFVLSKTYSGENVFPQQPQTATVVKIDGKRCGVYMDENNKLFAVELVCPHLGCGLIFNQLEKTWDCPCHGSRFDFYGNLIEGVSVRNLKKIRI